MWEQLVGQDAAVDQLRRAARRPGHAYLITGPPGSGAAIAARCFAAALVGGESDPGIADRVMRGVHPDVVEFEPGATQYRIKEDVREGVITEAMRAPVESARKVLVLHEAERLRGNQNEAANALLKTLEEPPPRTIIVLVTGLADDLLPTIRSRCQRVDLESLTDDVLRSVLVAEGASPDDVEVAVRLAGGQLARARALAGPLAHLRATFATIAARVDGTGSAAVALADEADAALEEAAALVVARQEEELRELDAHLERDGYEGRDAKRQRTRVEERHKRELRRTRQDLLLEGITALETVYRDVIAEPAEPLNVDRDRLSLTAHEATAALDACHAVREAFLLNEKGSLQIAALAMRLPRAS